MAIVQTKVTVRNKDGKKRLKELSEDKTRKLEEQREKFSAISVVVKKKSKLLKKKRIR